MLELKNITKSYLQYCGGSFIKKKKRIEAINNISFKISKKEKVGIVGLNGSGKSTLIKLILGVLVKDEGEIKLFGKDPVKNRKSLSKNYGVIFGQKSNLIWDLSARDAYEILKEIYSINNNDFEKILDFLMEHIDIKEIIDVPIRQLSLGQRMKLEVVSLLLHRPKLIVFDEALIGIDFMTKRDINRLLDVYIKNNNASLILTSHDINDINEFTGRYLIIDKGRILCDMTKSELDQYKDFSTLILKFNSTKVYNNQIDFLNLDKNQCIIDCKEYEGKLIVKILSNKNYIDKLINSFNSKYYDSAIIEPVNLENLVELYKRGFII